MNAWDVLDIVKFFTTRPLKVNMVNQWHWILLQYVLEQKKCFWKKNNKCKVIYEKINEYFNSPRIMVLIKFLSHIDHFPHQDHKMYLKGLTSRDINLQYRKLCQSFHNLRILKTKPYIWRTVKKPLPGDYVETHMVSCTSYTYCLFISR